MPADICEALARRFSIGRERVLSILELLDAGLHSVFIAHYRKSATGGLDDTAISRLAEERRELLFLEDLRQKARRIAEQAKALTEHLAKAIAEANEPELIEDLIRPYRPRRRTAGLVAYERGLGPLARFIANPPADGPDLPVKAAEFVNPAKEVRSPEEAVAGAGHILAERVAEDPRVRQAVRRLIWDRGILKSQQSKEGGKAAAEFKGYFQFQEAINRLPPHRVLALNRGERSKALKLTIELPPDAIKEKIFPVILTPDHRFRACLEEVAADALARLVLPNVDREVRRQLTDRAEGHAIEVFAANLRSLLMARPVRGRKVLAIQPGYRTGCKVAAIDAAGALLGETIIYPLEPQKKWAEGKAALAAEVQRHATELVAIGNGTGCREVEQLVAETIEEAGLAAEYAIISEAGAAVYADSDLAKEEFPNLDAAIRATVSIGRRLQDPLTELVKIDSRAIGVGLYQHDVNQQRLRQALEETMESCVAAIGVDANAASASMLRRVPGLDAQQVQSLLAHRAQAPLKTREELRALAGWDDRMFRSAAGFLRIRGDSPLDATRVHPESYTAAEKLLAHFGHGAADLASPESAQAVRKHLTGIALEPLAAQLEIPLADLGELASALQNPDFDPRSQHHGPVFRRKMRKIEDLTPGMWVKGTVRNVVDFGAFVDIGLKEDGLVHISQFSRRYVRNPLKFLHVGDVVDVRIVSIEADKHRIALTLLGDEPKKGEPQPAAAKPRRERRPPRQPRAGPARPSAPAAAGEAAAAPSQATPETVGAGTSAQGVPPAPRRPAPSDRRAPRDGQQRGRRPSPQGRTPARAGAPGGEAGERPRGPRRGPRDRRPPRTGPPRVIISKGTTETEDRAPDVAGRPKIRWAYYESDPEEEVFEETVLADLSAVASAKAEASATDTPSPPPVESTPAEPVAAEPAPAEPVAAEPPPAEPPPPPPPETQPPPIQP